MSARFSEFTRLAAIAALFLLASCAEDTPLGPGGGGNDTLPGPDPTDTIPPVTIMDGLLEVSLGGEAAVFSWSAPHDNEPDQPVDHYEIRYAYTLGFPPPAFWEGLSTPVVDPPSPLAPGTKQSYVFTDLDPGRDLWVGIRSYDADGNRSPGSDLAMAHVPGVEITGRCVDVMTGLPIEGLDVRVTSGPGINLTTDVNGEFTVEDLIGGASSVELSKGSAGTDYHALNQIFVITGDTTHTFAMIPYEQTTDFATPMSRLALFKIMTETTGSPGLLATWHRFPVPVHIPPFVNANGVDYAAHAQTAAQKWMDRTGIQLFMFVSEKPDTGITVVYRSKADLDPLTAFTKHVYGADSHPINREIHVQDEWPLAEEEFLGRVMLHEFGHTIRLGHVSQGSFIMYESQPLPDGITDDEVAMVVLLHALPARVNMSIYDESAP